MRRIHARLLAPGFSCTPKAAINSFGDKTPQAVFQFSGYLVERETKLRDDQGDERISRSYVVIDADIATRIVAQDTIAHAAFGTRQVLAVARYYKARNVLDYGIVYMV